MFEKKSSLPSPTNPKLPSTIFGFSLEVRNILINVKESFVPLNFPKAVPPSRPDHRLLGSAASLELGNGTTSEDLKHTRKGWQSYSDGWYRKYTYCILYIYTYIYFGAKHEDAEKYITPSMMSGTFLALYLKKFNCILWMTLKVNASLIGCLDRPTIHKH